jgi:putative methyltransferase
MKTVYFVQANYCYGNAVYLPYAVGCLAAYAWQDEEIRREYRLGRFVFLREPIAEAVDSLDEPFLVAFSCYVWNFEYNKSLAQAVKTRFPQCLVLFGGHHVPFGDARLLEECPYVDFLIHEEGEEPVAALLRALARSDLLAGVPNLSYRGSTGEILRNAVRPATDADTPSPYLTGLFDDLLLEYPYEFSATLETNRGCPFSCAFCDWGTLRGALQQFPMERIAAEIAWFAAHKIDHVYCADANFGIFPRDHEIVELLVEQNRRTGYPQKFRACYTKNSDEAVFALNKRLSEVGMSKGATLSFQSVSPVVLQNIGRKNLSLERFRELMKLYRGEGIPTQSELILGLPGETLESFVQGVGTLFEAGQHSSLNIYNCELLPNARLAQPTALAEYGIQTILARAGRSHCQASEADETEEKTCLICQTNTLCQDDWKQAFCFAVLAQSWHCLGPLQLAAIFLRYEKSVPYSDFYWALMTWAAAHPETMPGRMLATLMRKLDAIFAGGGTFSYVNPVFGDIVWPMEEGLFLETAHELDAFYADIRPFLCTYGIEEDLLDALLQYQKAMVKLPQRPAPLPVRYDFPAYFARIFRQE